MAGLYFFSTKESKMNGVENFDSGNDLNLMKTNQGAVCSIGMDLIDPNPDQPRLDFDAVALDALANSINKIDLIQPITVKPVGNRFQIIAGERRFRAYLKLNRSKIEAIVRPVDDLANKIIALTENISRQDLTDYEVCRAIRKISIELKNIKELATKIGINRTEIYRYLAFEALPDYIIADLEINPKLLSRVAAEQIKNNFEKSS